MARLCAVAVRICVCEREGVEQPPCWIFRVSTCLVWPNPVMAAAAQALRCVPAQSQHVHHHPQPWPQALAPVWGGWVVQHALTPCVDLTPTHHLKPCTPSSSQPQPLPACCSPPPLPTAPAHQPLACSAQPLGWRAWPQVVGPMQPLAQFTDKDRFSVAAKTCFHRELALCV